MQACAAGYAYICLTATKGYLAATIVVGVTVAKVTPASFHMHDLPLDQLQANFCFVIFNDFCLFPT
jgi:hypothetical protein